MKKAIIILISVGIVLAGLIVAVNHQKRDTAEGGTAESSLAFAEQDLTTGKMQVQYKLASDAYQLSGTFGLDAPVFQWK